MDSFLPRRRDALRQERSALEASPDERSLPTDATLADRAQQAMVASGFRPLLMEHGQVVLSGFVIEPDPPRHVKVRWVGQPEIDSAPYRRTFLSVYAAILVEAGLTVRQVAEADDAYLVCRAS